MLMAGRNLVSRARLLTTLPNLHREVDQRRDHVDRPQQLSNTSGENRERFGLMNALSNEHQTKVITEGGASVGKTSMMAAWGGPMTDEEIRDMVEFVRALSVPAYSGPMP